MSDHRRRPALGSLRVFVAAARSQSVTGAAAALHLTHGAVSHQLRQLQDRLGIALFERHGRGLRLTAHGAAYAEELARAFADIDQATDRLLASRAYRRLRVSCMPSFAARWLLPRLGNFIARHPDYDVEVQSSARLADIKGGEADVALRFGHGRYPEIAGATGSSVAPGCASRGYGGSPASTPGSTSPSSAAGSSTPDEHWQPWFSAAGLVIDEPQRGAIFDDSSLMLMAAASGQGVALARHTLAVDDLASGRLLRLFTTIIESPLAYYFLSRPADEEQPAVVSFRDWLFQEAASYCPPAGEAMTATGQGD
ncbi:LysR substrate-binding domain-containing protein [Accumulibacter sp.]|uniref:LysR substrate-binding domain-containing protein n=1 Tax=Accumulibacter sp. TaxID=2053492 RepID=UPI0025F2EAE4|nr:LysR substrate-binding domain-containing protein [Accumulibacter sp.]MCM8614053.1 LysR substrate-binding domain-containing protein [Accumulibacter sp.]MCM8637826.1 LysR substrate-binding domain-containing protein [Accumulibacter sp.]MCM8641197.1 LysR substrate-binding domain-containing protein [Accumulibacter sp.]